MWEFVAAFFIGWAVGGAYSSALTKVAHSRKMAAEIQRLKEELEKLGQ